MDIIGGPAIRRTDSSATYIWLVVDEKPDSIIITVSTNADLSKPLAVSRATPSSIIKLGDRLFNCLIKVSPANNSFPTDTKLFYDIKIGEQTLANFNLLTGNNAITYNNEPLPSFIVASKHRNILQGSCRKPHAANKSNFSQFDQMRTADALLNRSVNKPSTRPTMLCLTGDQIYADDVALPLLCALKEKAYYHLGWHEELPHAKDKNRVVIPNKLKLADRGKTLTTTMGFTSSEKDNHLMGFGEFMMMYLAAWGGLSLTIPAFSEIKDNIKRITRRRKRNKNVYREYKITNGDYDEQRNIVNTFLSNAHKTRRVMANIPTYMMFDDHEITDDWNLTKKNAERLKGNPLSKRIQANGLAAYWACQGWGNNPKAFTGRNNAIISKFLLSKSHKNASEYENILFRQRWNYTVEGYPVLVALDTRTRRKFNNGILSQLMSPAEIKLLKNEFLRLNKIYKGNSEQQSLLLLSPSPFLGFTAMERIQLAAGKLDNAIDTVLDSEPWIGSATAYKQMKNTLKATDFKQCCIISGDVHYAFSRYEQVPRTNKQALEIIQITSSALHNAPVGMVLMGLGILEKDIFNRQKTPYLHPLNEDDFLNGHTNINLLEYESGHAVKSTYTFFNPDSGKTYKWVYNLKEHHPVNFS